MLVVYILAGFVAGAFIAYYFATQKNAALEVDKAVAIQKAESVMEERENLKTSLNALQGENQNINKHLSVLQTENKNLLEKLSLQKSEMLELNQKLNNEFELIATRLLRQNSNEISEIHNKNISTLLQPLKEKIISFEKKVEDTYDKELREKNDLRTEIKILHELNKRISDEANNLTKALKGDTKKQGNWGEIILERVLERSGLNKGQEYELQFSTQNDENKRIQPDVLVFLPENKHIIIDAKVSLVAYERFINTNNDEDRQKFLREHISSIKTHINGLSDKKYYTSNELITPDFVLMFVPLESSFSTAMQADNELFAYGWDRKIVLVSPTTLLATLRTIASVWKQENQTKNAIEIARQGGALFDKFVLFVSDLEKIGKSIETLQSTHSEAVKKLHTGKGNLITRANNIKKLGANATKSFPEQLSGSLIEDDDIDLIEN